MPQVATARMVKHPLQSWVEVTEGTFPTTGTGLAVPFTSLKFSIDGQYQDIEQVGPEDLLASIRGNKITDFQVDTVLSADTWDLLKWFTNPINFTTPTGTPAESRSFLFSIRLNGTVNYIKMVGVKPNSYTPKIEAGKVVSVSFDFKCVDINDPTTTAPTGVTLTTAFPTGAVYHHKNASVSWHGTTLVFKDLSYTCNRDAQQITVAGQELPYNVQCMGLNLAGTITEPFGINTVNLTDFNADTESSFVITFASAKTVTFNGKLKKKNTTVDTGAKDASPSVWDFGFVDTMSVSA